jgi:hypothetical protein
MNKFVKIAGIIILYKEIIHINNQLMCLEYD